MKRLIACIAALCILLPGLISAQTVVPVSASVVPLATTNDSEQRNYLVLDLPAVEVPDGMKLEEAYVEFYMDVSSEKSEDVTGGLVTLEIYPYTGANKKALEVSDLGASAMKRTVRVGSDRPIRVYVTDFLASRIDDLSANRHLLVGSVSGDRPAIFDPQTVPGTSNAKATLTVFFTRTEDTVSGQSAE